MTNSRPKTDNPRLVIEDLPDGIDFSAARKTPTAVKGKETGQRVYWRACRLRVYAGDNNKPVQEVEEERDGSAFIPAGLEVNFLGAKGMVI